jgi:hypothetical protein
MSCKVSVIFRGFVSLVLLSLIFVLNPGRAQNADLRARRQYRRPSQKKGPYLLTRCGRQGRQVPAKWVAADCWRRNGVEGETHPLLLRKRAPFEPPSISAITRGELSRLSATVYPTRPTGYARERSDVPASCSYSRAESRSVIRYGPGGAPLRRSAEVEASLDNLANLTE